MKDAAGVIERWSESHPTEARWIEEDIEDCLACYAFPESHRRRIRTTNGLERFNQEIKRRTRVVRIFPNRESCLRLVSALCVEQSEEWLSGRRYLDMSLLEDHALGHTDRHDPDHPAEVNTVAAWKPTAITHLEEVTELSGLDLRMCVWHILDGKHSHHLQPSARSITSTGPAR